MQFPQLCRFFGSRGGVDGGVQLRMRRSVFRVLYARYRPPQRRYRLDRLGVCGARADTRKIIEMGIRHHLAGLSLSNTVILLEDLGVERSRTAIHDWVQKANLQPKAVRVRIALRSIRRRSRSTMSSTGCTPRLIQKLIEFSIRGCFRRIRSRLRGSFSPNQLRNTASETPCFSSTTPTISSEDSAKKGSATAFNYTASGTRSNVSFVRYNDEPLRSQTASATSIQPPQKHGFKPTPSGGIMSKLTPPMPKPALNAIRTIVFDTSYSTN